MTMSRMPAVLTMLLAAAASPAAGQSNLTTEQAFENYRKMFEPPSAAACEGEPDPEAIVVCGRRPAIDPNRLPLPVEREPGERIRGEPAAMGSGCMRSCHQPVQVDLIGAGAAVVEGIKKILDPDR